MKTAQVKFAGDVRAAGVQPSITFLTSAGDHPFRRFGLAVIASFLVHLFFFGLSLTHTIINPPEVYEINQIDFVDENETPPEPVRPEPVEREKEPELVTPGSTKPSEDVGTAQNQVKTPGNDNADNPNGAINAQKGAQEVDVNSLGVLGVLEGVSENGNSDAKISLNMQAADGVVKDLKMSRSLKVGRGHNTTGQVDENALEAISKSGKGIDDLIGRTDAGEGVAMRKKGRVNVERLGLVSGSKEAMGARSEESLRKVLTDNMGRLQYIYEKHLKTNPDIGGKVEVEVTINADGGVGSVNILRSEIALPALQQDILDAVRRWRYDTITSGSVKVVYPVVFVKMG